MTDDVSSAGSSLPAAGPRPALPLAQELRTILALAGPLMAAQGGMMLMGVVDTAVVGRSGALDMAAVALGNTVAATIVVFGICTVMGLEPLVSQAHGAGEEAATRRWLWQGLWLALVLSIPLTVITALAPTAFQVSGLAPDLAERASAYLYPRLVSVPLFCLLGALRSYLSSRGNKWPIVAAVVAANAINLVLDIGLVHGELGFPKLGAAGAAWATNGAVFLLVSVLALGVWREKISAEARAVSRRWHWPSVKRVFELGWPIGSQATVETALFMTVAWAIGKMGDVYLAGHSIAVTVASLSFMAAMGIATAATARVGFHIGAGAPAEARRAGFLAIATGALFMGACGLVCLLFPEEISLLFTDDVAAVATGTTLVIIAGVFALSDGVQAVAGGALRGAGDTRWPFFTHLGGYWFFGLPIGYALAVPGGLGPEGYWWGLTASLTIIALVLLLRFHVRSKRTLARL